MRIGIAADHGGFTMKERMAVALKSAGHDVTDFGALQLEPADNGAERHCRRLAKISALEREVQ